MNTSRSAKQDVRAVAVDGLSSGGMIDDLLRDHLKSGVSLIVGSVSISGEPHAAKGFGVDVVGDDLVRVFLDASEATLIDNVRSTNKIAVTTGDVYTFRSMQMKGQVESLHDTTPDELPIALALSDAFFAKIGPLQNLPIDALRVRLPAAFMTCTVRISATFDQTPGPRAGALLGGSAS